MCASDLDILFFSETQLFLDFSKKITSDRSETFLRCISLVVWLYAEIGEKKLILDFLLIHMVCLMCAVATMGFEA